MERDSLIILAPYVTLDTGTGCVHTAPGHGREDYLSGVKYGLPVLSPVDDGGIFTVEAGPYAGLSIFTANKQINEDLAKAGFLVKEGTVEHSYPHCWRCKKPVVFRATAQWFISMEMNDLRRKALDGIRQVDWTPRWGLDRIYGMVESRPDWCLSRQRAWGVPLTVIYCQDCGEVVNDPAIAERIVNLFSKEGADAWFKYDIAELIGREAVCLKCGSKSLVKEEDILDVWFDSGVSHAAVLEERPELRSPADLYLEGSDQHRGWFQSSLLTSVGVRGVPPYKGVLTHGFVVDGQGKKMSKSIGNVIAPEEVIKKYGAEILRLWVSSEDYRDDIKISDEILKQLSDAYRKIRNTMRYMFSNLYDFDPDRHLVNSADMAELDRWALHQFEILKRKTIRAYEAFEFHTVFHSMYQFCTVAMSSFYLDILKDRLYTSAADSPERRAAQTVLYEIADGLLRLMAPVLTFTAAEAWRFVPKAAGREDEPALALFPAENEEFLNPELAIRWDRLLLVRAEITKVLELARQNKVIGHPLEAEVVVTAQGDLVDFIKQHLAELQVIAIVSALHYADQPAEGSVLSDTVPGLSVLVRPAAGEKCERCWNFRTEVGRFPDHPTICARCHQAINS